MNGKKFQINLKRNDDQSRPILFRSSWNYYVLWDRLKANISRMFRIYHIRLQSNHSVRTPLQYGHLSVTDSFQCPDKILIFSLKKPQSIIQTLSNTDKH